MEGYSQRFTYKFQNPAFGGDTFNYQWLLSSAQAQDTTKDPDLNSSLYGSYTQDPLQSFADDLNRQVLNQLSRELIVRQFGEDGIQEGTYTLGDYQIVVGNVASGLNITITDSKTGASTLVEIPFF